MYSSGKYTEKLPCGGTLEVINQSWQVEYYFPGPDLRHNGEFFRIPGSSLEKYINALIANWTQFQALKAAIPYNGEFKTVGELGMCIQVGGYHEGVCLKSYHMPINTQTKLENVLASYRYALQRAPQVASLMEKL